MSCCVGWSFGLGGGKDFVAAAPPEQSSESTPHFLGHVWPDSLSLGEAIFAGLHLPERYCGAGVRQTWARRTRGPRHPHLRTAPSEEQRGVCVIFRERNATGEGIGTLVVDNISSKNAISGLITKTLFSFSGSLRTWLWPQNILCPAAPAQSRLNSPPLSKVRRLLKRVAACTGPPGNQQRTPADWPLVKY